MRLKSSPGALESQRKSTTHHKNEIREQEDMELVLPDLNMAFDDVGSGQPILLIHGFPLNREMWKPQIEALSAHFRVVAPDLRGHGETPPTPGPYTMEMLADDCHTLLQALGIKERVVVCGLSMGGYVTLAFYRRHPERVAGLVLASTRAAADTPEGKANRDRAAEQAREEGPQTIVAAMLPKMLSPQTYSHNRGLVAEVERIMSKTSLEGMIAALLGMKERADSTDLLGQISVPTLIIHGADDQLISIKEAESMHRAIKNAQLVILPHAGHLPNLEQSQFFNKTLLEFINK
jgi:pimeloyl-ACP methyl ester carboxylesterase